MHSYDDVDLRRPARRASPSAPAELGLVVEEPGSGWCGAVVECDRERVSLEDRHGAVRVFPLGVFLVDGSPVTLVRPTVWAEIHAWVTTYFGG